VDDFSSHVFLLFILAQHINRRLTTPTNLAAQNLSAPHFVKILRVMLFSIIACRFVTFIRCETG